MTYDQINPLRNLLSGRNKQMNRIECALSYFIKTRHLRPVKTMKLLVRQLKPGGSYRSSPLARGISFRGIFR